MTSSECLTDPTNPKRIGRGSFDNSTWQWGNPLQMELQSNCNLEIQCPKSESPVWDHHFPFHFWDFMSMEAIPCHPLGPLGPFSTSEGWEGVVPVTADASPAAATEAPSAATVHLMWDLEGSPLIMGGYPQIKWLPGYPLVI